MIKQNFEAHISLKILLNYYNANKKGGKNQYFFSGITTVVVLFADFAMKNKR